MLDRWNRYLNRLNITLYPYQEELVYRLLEFPYNAKITQSRQSGKSFVLALVIYFLAYVKEWDIVITAPKIGQTEYIMKHIHRCQDIIKAKTSSDSTYKIYIKGKGSITCLSGSDTANVEGASAHLVVIDEHQDLPAERASTVFIPMLSYHNGLYWSCGKGGSPSSVAERKETDFTWSLPWQEVVKVKPEYIRLVELAKLDSLPEEFAANYECKSLDISAHLLVPSIEAYDGNINNVTETICGVDWGKRLDRTVATVVDISPQFTYIKDWLVPTGTYDEQMDQLVYWLKGKVHYDRVIAETNGVGDGCTDFLINAMKDPKGYDSGISGIDATQKWKTEQAKKVNRMTGNKTLLYNPNHSISGPFLKEITNVEYKMLDSQHLKLSHSDFLSSLFLALDEGGSAYL